MLGRGAPLSRTSGQDRWPSIGAAASKQTFDVSDPGEVVCLLRYRESQLERITSGKASESRDHKPSSWDWTTAAG